MMPEMIKINLAAAESLLLLLSVCWFFVFFLLFAAFVLGVCCLDGDAKCRHQLVHLCLLVLYLELCFLVDCGGA